MPTIVFVVMTETRRGKRKRYGVCRTQAAAEHAALVASRRHHQAWYVPDTIEEDESQCAQT